MKKWIVSDLHFYHDNIIKYCDRPYEDASHMNEMIIKEFNEKVAPDDHVYHIGDFMFGKPTKENFFAIFDRLPGIWHFVLGNHDKKTLKRWKNELVEHERIEEIANQIDLVHDNKLFILNHYDSENWNPEQTDYEDVFLLFGHMHSSPDAVFKENTVDVGFDSTRCELKTIEEQMSRMVRLVEG
jgi:calcineurin-like phosphoesterase family protein